SAVGLSRFPLHQPGAPWARAPASGLGFGSTGLKGRKETTGRRTGRRRAVKRGVERGRTGDIAHLGAGASISLFLRPVKRICRRRSAIGWKRLGNFSGGNREL